MKKMMLNVKIKEIRRIRKGIVQDEGLMWWKIQ